MFECAYCNKKFGKKFNLIRHINVHMEGRIIRESSLVPSIDLETINLNFDSPQGKYTVTTDIYSVFFFFN